MFTTASLALSALALTVSAHDPNPAKAPEGERAEESRKEAKEDRKICRRVTDGIGSRRKVRLCYTKEQWLEFNKGQ